MIRLSSQSYLNYCQSLQPESETNRAVYRQETGFPGSTCSYHSAHLTMSHDRQNRIIQSKIGDLPVIRVRIRG